MRYKLWKIWRYYTLPYSYFCFFDSSYFQENGEYGIWRSSEFCSKNIWIRKTFARPPWTQNRSKHGYCIAFSGMMMVWYEAILHGNCQQKWEKVAKRMYRESGFKKSDLTHDSQEGTNVWSDTIWHPLFLLTLLRSMVCCMNQAIWKRRLLYIKYITHYYT